MNTERHECVASATSVAAGTATNPAKAPHVFARAARDKLAMPRARAHATGDCGSVWRCRDHAAAHSFFFARRCWATIQAYTVSVGHTRVQGLADNQKQDQQLLAYLGCRTRIAAARRQTWRPPARPRMTLGHRSALPNRMRRPRQGSRCAPCKPELLRNTRTMHTATQHAHTHAPTRSSPANSKTRGRENAPASRSRAGHARMHARTHACGARSAAQGAGLARCSAKEQARRQCHRAQTGHVTSPALC